MARSKHRIRARARARARRRAAPWQGTLRLGMVFVVLVGANVYFFFFRGGTSLRDLARTSRMQRASGPPVSVKGAASVRALAAARAGGVTRPREDASLPPEEGDDEGRILEGVLSDNDTLERVWRREGLPPRLVGELAAALGKVFDLRTERGGHRWTIRLDAADRLQAVEYRVSPNLAYRVERSGGLFVASRDSRRLETRVAEIGGAVQTTFAETVRRAGEGPALIGLVAEALAGDLDLYSDVNLGDAFRILVEKKLLDGKMQGYGRLLAAEFRGKAGTVRTFWFEPSDGSPGGFYTEHGENSARTLLRSPLKYHRLAWSTDRRRMRPQLHVDRTVLGADYPAPSGTPVWATEAGRVTFVGRRGPAGHTVHVESLAGTETVYSQLGRFGRGIQLGATVRQRQVIGYVGAGSAGRPPHLHYGVKIDGLFVDPTRLRAGRESSLAANHRVEFADAIAPRLNALIAIDAKPRESLAARLP